LTREMRYYFVMLAAFLAACGGGGGASPTSAPVDTPDTTPPEITLNGDNPQLIAAGEPYVELGATAIDNRDGDLSQSSVIDANDVDLSVPGTYQVSYNVRDEAGNAATTVNRIVIVEDRTPPVISLLGENPQIVLIGNPYIELGATAIDNVDGDLTDGIVIDANSVDIAVAGDYSATYDVSDTAGNEAATLTRTVIVRPPPDTTAPVITLIGSNPHIIPVDEAYVELGATATDNVDGDLTASIIIDASAVDSSVPGTYQVSYNVRDAAGNTAATVTRTVIYADRTPPVITLLGDNPQFIVLDSAYIELGATATDNVDGHLTDNIVVDATGVNVAAIGDYDVTYDVRDAAGNAAETVTRTVTVHSIVSIDLWANTFLMIANGTSSPELKLAFIDEYGDPIDISDVTYELLANGVPQSTSQFTTMLSGDYALKIVAYGVESNVVDVRAREQKSYPTVTIPIIFHIVHFGEAIGVYPNLLQSEVSAVLDRLTAEFSNQMGSIDPNAVDTSIRFRAATIAPDGSILSEPGIRRFDGTAYDDGVPDNPSRGPNDIAGDRLFSRLEGRRLGEDTFWDPRQYLNIWILTNYRGSYATFPKVLDSNPLPGLDSVPADYEPSTQDFPMVVINAKHKSTWIVGHEVGHNFGLLHPFAHGCGPTDYCDDTYSYLHDEPDSPCPGNLGLMESTTIMDYVGALNTFTYEQRERIRFVLDNAIWVRELQYSDQ
jgi:PKD repeat protein